MMIITSMPAASMRYAALCTHSILAPGSASAKTGNEPPTCTRERWEVEGNFLPGAGYHRSLTIYISSFPNVFLIYNFRSLHCFPRRFLSLSFSLFPLDNFFPAALSKARISSALLALSEMSKSFHFSKTFI